MKTDVPEELSYFSEILTDLMKKKKMTIMELAGELGCEYSTAQRYTSGKTFPSLPGLIVISKIFDVPIEYFISYKEDQIERWNSEGKFKVNRTCVTPDDVMAMLDSIGKSYMSMAEKIKQKE